MPMAPGHGTYSIPLNTRNSAIALLPINFGNNTRRLHEISPIYATSPLLYEYLIIYNLKQVSSPAGRVRCKGTEACDNSWRRHRPTHHDGLRSIMHLICK